MRCQQLTLVAQVGEHQYLAYCEHGSIHLGWYYGTFHLQWDDFRRIVRLLERSMETPDFTKLQGEGCSLIRQKNSCLQLWLGPAALFLGETELSRLIELVLTALPLLNRLQIEGGEIELHNIAQYYHINRSRAGGIFGAN